MSEYVTTSEAARMLEVSPRYVGVLTERGTLEPAAQAVNGRWMVRLYLRTDVEELRRFRRGGRKGDE